MAISKNGKARKALVRAHMQTTGLTYQAANAALGQVGAHPTVGQVVDWFFENYEDPANGVPRDDGEYFYVLGGPYDAQEEIEDHYGNIPDKILEDALGVIHRQGFEWIKTGQY